MAEIISDLKSSGLRQKILAVTPQPIKDAYRSFKEGVTFPLETEVEVDGHIAKFLVGNFRERSRVLNLGHEGRVIEEMLDCLKEGNTLLDVGAHVGTYTMFAANSGHSVIAVEPDRKIYNRLVKNVDINSAGSKATLVNCAAGEVDGVFPIFSSGIDAISPSVGVNVHKHKNSGEVVVKTVDEIVGSDVPSIIKIDVEGMELEVVKGMEKTLRNDKTNDIFIEVHYKLMKNRGQDPKELFLLMNEAGYSANSIDSFIFGDRTIWHFRRNQKLN